VHYQSFYHSLLQGRARQLYKAGYKTLQSIAKADSKEIKKNIPYLSNKIVTQIIAAAKVSHIIYKKILTTFMFFLLKLVNYSF